MAIQPTILLVEDETDLRHIVAESLEAQGFAVAQAADAADALGRLEGFAYDGLVLDLALPDGNGMDVLDAALARYPGIRSVVMTGSGGVPEAVAAIKRGAIDFFTKPFPLRDLAKRLADGFREDDDNDEESDRTGPWSVQLQAGHRSERRDAPRVAAPRAGVADEQHGDAGR
jgi:DNA-binding NtrC family response regulator